MALTLTLRAISIYLPANTWSMGESATASSPVHGIFLPVWSFHVLFHGQILHFRHSALVECVDLKDVQNKHFVASSIKDLFDNVEAQKIVDFIKETRFYKQL